MVIISRKTLPIFLGTTVYALYITYVYVIFRALRGVLVPNTSAIIITDARDPVDLLMLCETIQLCRLKQWLKKEEELYFLLIDIMRSPVVFKAICGGSIKTSDPQEEGQALGREHRPPDHHHHNQSGLHDSHHLHNQGGHNLFHRRQSKRAPVGAQDRQM